MKTHIVKLTCTHSLSSSPKEIGSELYCVKCGQIRKVMSSHTQWVWKCLDCPATKSYPGSKLKGHHGAIKHRQKTGHAVEYRDGSGKLLWTSAQYTQESLPLDNEPPF